MYYVSYFLVNGIIKNSINVFVILCHGIIKSIEQIHYISHNMYNKFKKVCRQNCTFSDLCTAEPNFSGKKFTKSTLYYYQYTCCFTNYTFHNTLPHIPFYMRNIIYILLIINQVSTINRMSSKYFSFSARKLLSIELYVVKIHE